MKIIQEPGLLGARVFRFQACGSLAGLRLTQAISRMVGELSVRGAKGLVDRGRTFADSKRARKASLVLKEGMWVEVHLDREEQEQPSLQPGDIIWEGWELLAVNKPPGLLVHGTRGIEGHTVIPRLDRLLRETGRSREKDCLTLVHRLDKDTSGLLLVARTSRTARAMDRLFRQRRVSKRYHALVHGNPRLEDFQRMAPVKPRKPSGARKGSHKKDPKGAMAETAFQVLEHFSSYSLVEAKPLSGRTHQIRVHLSQIGHPVLGDIVYGPAVCRDPLHRAVPRQMLHAAGLAFRHPETGAEIKIEAPLPDDMQAACSWLKRDI